MVKHFLACIFILISFSCRATNGASEQVDLTSNNDQVANVPLKKQIRSEEYNACTGLAVTRVDFTVCQDKELGREDKALNQAYKVAMGDIQEFRRDELKKMQRLWIQYRDARCQFFYHKESGSGGQNDMMDCFIDMTQQRTEELIQLY